MSRSILLLLLLLPVNCTTSYWMERADREVGDVLAEKRRSFEDFRASGLVRPAEVTEEEKAEEVPPDLSDVPREVGLADALAVATELNRNYLAERESLYLSALALTGVRNQFSPVFAGTMTALLSDTNATDRVNTDAAGLRVSQILPTGGVVTLSGDAAAADVGPDGAYRWDADAAVDFTQPLLKDAGYETSHEALTQAERNVVYAIRDFELYREDFTIGVTSEFYSLVRQQREITNAERDLAAREFLMKQSRAKFEVGLATEVDKLRAEREYLRAQNDLLQQKEAWALSLDRFKIRLGLPTSFPLTIRSEEPRYSKVEISLSAAVEAALHNRLDLLTARDRVEDSERNVRIQVNQFLPALDLTGTYGRSAADAGSPSDLDFDASAWTIGLSLTLPLERTSERNAIRAAMIDLDRTKRSLTLSEDNVILEVRNSLRRLRRAETTLEIREREIEAARKEAEAAQIRFEAGEMDNRNVTDAQNAVLRAENAYIGDLVEYEVARIQLMRDVGILFIDENGKWVEP